MAARSRMYQGAKTWNPCRFQSIRSVNPGLSDHGVVASGLRRSEATQDCVWCLDRHGLAGHPPSHFVIAGETYGPVRPGLRCLNESKRRLRTLLPDEGETFRYEYDMQDGWFHDVEVAQIAPVQEAIKFPLCLDGKRACPPESCGGHWGYEEFLQANPKQDYQEYRWLYDQVGTGFDPEEFDIEEVNRQLRKSR